MLSGVAHSAKPTGGGDTSPPAPVIEATAEKVSLRKNCTVDGNALVNCFTTHPALTTWMQDTRKPNASSPLHVDIGPGLFGVDGGGDINISCDAAVGYTGHTTFAGSGSKNTILKGNGSGGTSAVNIKNCTELNFSDLSIETYFYGGIYWSGGGNSRWTNVVVDTNARAWDEPACGAERGQHYWYSSKLKTTAFFGFNSTYQTKCDETWFFGSEVTAYAPAGQSTSNSSGVINALDQGIIHLYGSNLGSISDGVDSLPAASVSGGGQIHIHGTGIDVISTTGKDIVALSAASNGSIHANVTAFNLNTSGTITRISNNGGSVSSPYQWKQGNQPPMIVSENGADMTVEINCDAAACHDVDTGTETHLLIYNENCTDVTHGPWFDVVTGRCRGQIQ